MRLTIIIYSILAWFFLSSLSAEVTIESTPMELYEYSIENNECKSQVWKDHRKKFYYNFQGVSHYNDTIIISEPPPHVKLLKVKTEAGIHKISEADIFTCDSLIGEDGFRRDIVIENINKLKQEDIDSLKKKLSILLFGSEFYAKSPESIQGKDYNYNYPLRLSQLKSYLKKSFPKQDFDNLEKIKSDVYLSSYLVAYVLESDQNLDQKKFREFALYSDIVLGGVYSKSKKKLAIVARRRYIPTADLPALRFESVDSLIRLISSGKAKSELLSIKNDILELIIEYSFYSYSSNMVKANAIEKQLVEKNKKFNELKNNSIETIYQSIEDYHAFYKIPEFLRNRIPNEYVGNYFSNELVDSEIGQLLTINDFIIKSKSEKGFFKGYNVPYIDNGKYPFVKDEFRQAKYEGILSYDPDKKNSGSISGLSEQEADEAAIIKSGLIYNWSDNQLIQESQLNSQVYLIPLSTSSLNVSYIPKGQKTNLDLKKLSKKAELYFSNGEGKNVITANVTRYVILYQLLSSLNLSSINSNSNKKIVRIKEFKEFEKDSAKIILSYSNDSEISNILDNCSDIRTQLFTKIAKREYKSYSEISKQESEIKKCEDSYYNLLNAKITKEDNEKLIATHQNLSNEINEKKNKFASNTWLQTPTLIKTISKDYFIGTGGHNIGSNPQKVEIPETPRHTGRERLKPLVRNGRFNGFSFSRRHYSRELIWEGKSLYQDQIGKKLNQNEIDDLKNRIEDYLESLDGQNNNIQFIVPEGTDPMPINGGQGENKSWPHQTNNDRINCLDNAA